MGLPAAVAYLRLLRERQKISQSKVARAAGVESKQVHRWERGKSEPSALGIAAFIQAVNARPDDVQRLLMDGNATVTEAQVLAETVLEVLRVAATS